MAIREVQIEFGDCDPAGIVFYPNYFRMFDAATAGLFQLAFGMTKAGWTKRFGILGIPMVDTDAKFIFPCKFGDRVRIESRVESFGRSSFKVAHTAFNGEKKAVEGRETRVWVAGTPSEPETLKAVSIPDEVRRALLPG